MRPTLSLPRLFGPPGPDPRDTIPDDDGPDTERETLRPVGGTGEVANGNAVAGRSYIALRQAGAEPPSSPAHALLDLDAFLAARLLRLEVTSTASDGGAFLAHGRVLRGALSSAGMYGDPFASPAPATTFEARLGEALRGVYGWAYGALDAAFLSEHVRPLPKRVVQELAALAEEAVKMARFEGAMADLAALLRDVKRTSERMASRGI
jgi:hypothetical protein